jgi:hypothetical protein
LSTHKSLLPIINKRILNNMYKKTNNVKINQVLLSLPLIAFDDDDESVPR